MPKKLIQLDLWGNGTVVAELPTTEEPEKTVPKAAPKAAPKATAAAPFGLRRFVYDGPVMGQYGLVSPHYHAETTAKSLTQAKAFLSNRLAHEMGLTRGKFIFDDKYFV